MVFWYTLVATIPYEKRLGNRHLKAENIFLW